MIRIQAEVGSQVDPLDEQQSSAEGVSNKARCISQNLDELELASLLPDLYRPLLVKRDTSSVEQSRCDDTILVSCVYALTSIPETHVALIVGRPLPS
jgi:hypothetical protein